MLSFFFRMWKFKFLANFQKILALTLKKKSTVLDGFFPYLAQMIYSMRGCVAYNDLWPWPISLRSFGIGLKNRVRSVASTVLDGFFPYQGWGQVLSEVLESITSTFKICKFKYKYKYSQYLDGINYIKYFFVQVQVPSTLVTNNSTVSYNHYPGTYSYI